MKKLIKRILINLSGGRPMQRRELAFVDSITVFDKNKIKLAGVKLAAEIRRRQND